MHQYNAFWTKAGCHDDARCEVFETPAKYGLWRTTFQIQSDLPCRFGSPLHGFDSLKRFGLLKSHDLIAPVALGRKISSGIFFSAVPKGRGINQSICSRKRTTSPTTKTAGGRTLCAFSTIFSNVPVTTN